MAPSSRRKESRRRAKRCGGAPQEGGQRPLGARGARGSAALVAAGFGVVALATFDPR